MAARPGARVLKIPIRREAEVSPSTTGNHICLRGGRTFFDGSENWAWRRFHGTRMIGFAESRSQVFTCPDIRFERL